MATSVVGSLVVALKVNSAKLVEGYQKASKKAGEFVKKTRKHLDTGAKAFAGLSLAATAGLAAIFKQQSATIDELAKFSDQLGITTESLAGLRHAAELTGTDTNVLDKSLVKLQANIGQAAQGVGAAVRNFDKLGLSATKLAKLGADEQFKAVADALQTVESQTERNTIVFEIFGAKGSALINTMKGGADAISAAQEEATTLGFALNRLDSAKVELANDAMHRAGQATEGFANTITVALAPYVQGVAESFYNAALESGGFAEITTKAVDVVLKGVEYLAKSIHGLSLIWSQLKVVANEALVGILEGISNSVQRINDVLGTGIGTGFLDGMVESFNLQADQLNQDVMDKLLNPLDEKFVAWSKEVARKSTEQAAAVAQSVMDELAEQNPYAKPDVQLKDGESNKDNKETNNKKLNEEKRFQDKLAKLKINSSKKVQMAQKALALKTAVIDGFMAIQKAWASAPFPFNLPAVAVTTLQTAANISGIRGARANGGSVGANQTYLVGERGPELFTPSTTGNITQNSELKTLTKQEQVNPSINFNINAVDASGIEELLIDNRALIYALISEAQAEKGTVF